MNNGPNQIVNQANSKSSIANHPATGNATIGTA
jgi:hypothetical protein